MARARPGDNEVLAVIQRLVAERPSSGDRRITALLNRERRRQGLASINRKRVLRIMQAHALVLTRHTAYPGPHACPVGQGALHEAPKDSSRTNE